MTMADIDSGAIRSLAVEIVDLVHGYTYEFSSSPNSHLDDYDRIEDLLGQRLKVSEGPSDQPRATPSDDAQSDSASNVQPMPDPYRASWPEATP